MGEDQQCHDCGCTLRDDEQKYQTCHTCMIDQYDDQDGVPCPKCQGDGYTVCFCAGDFCCCEYMGDAPCPVCYGEGAVTEEREEAYLHAEREAAKWHRKIAAKYDEPHQHTENEDE